MQFPGGAWGRGQPETHEAREGLLSTVRCLCATWMLQSSLGANSGQSPRSWNMVPSLQARTAGLGLKLAELPFDYNS